jgi:hypothetical protein
MAAPTYNLNAVRNGTRLARLTIGELPPDLAHVKREARAYRRGLEQAVVDAHGEVSVVHAHALDTAVQGQIHFGVCKWILRTKIDKMEVGDVMKCSGEMLRAKERRDAAVKTLDLDRNGRDLIDALYSPAPDIPEKPPDTPSNEHDDPTVDENTPDHESPVCDLCDDLGLAGRRCPSCREQSDG